MDRRTFVTCALSAATLALLPRAAWGFGREEHDPYLKEVLFENGDYPIAESDAVEALCAASYLCIDQYNGKGKAELNTLKKANVPNLPDSITDIDFGGNSTHRYKTHMGWDYKYDDDEEWNNTWKTRRRILLETVNHLFNFGFINEASMLLPNDHFCEQCKSFAALVYYVHIIGDHIDYLDQPTIKDDGSVAVNSAKNMIPFASKQPTDENPDVISELEKHLPILFPDANGSTDFTNLMNEIQATGSRARRCLGPNDKIYYSENLETFKGCAESLLEGEGGTLCTYVTRLLREEKFFAKTFHNA